MAVLIERPEEVTDIADTSSPSRVVKARLPSNFDEPADEQTRVANCFGARKALSGRRKDVVILFPSRVLPAYNLAIQPQVHVVWGFDPAVLYPPKSF